MASARGLAKFRTNSSYLPSLEHLRRSRHRGSAIARISSSVLSIMFSASFRLRRWLLGPLKTVIAGRLMFNASFCLPRWLLGLLSEVIARRFLHGVFAGFRIATRNGEHVPILVVHLHDVPSVVVTGPARLLAEQRVLRDALRGAVTVLELPRPQQLVKVLRGQTLEILLHDLELLQADVQELLVGHVADGIAAAVLVHELLQAIEPLLGVDVVRIDGARHDRVAIDAVVLEGLVDFLPAALDLLGGHHDAFAFSVVDVLASGLCGKTAFGERAG